MPDRKSSHITQNLGRLLSAWRANPGIASNINDWHSTPARPAQTQPFPDDLHPTLVEALLAVGIPSLYSHQNEAWQHTQAGENIVIVTSTASGKTLCYNLPVLNRLLCDPESRALYIFPTKALAQDQLSTLHRLLASIKDNNSNQASISAAIYDGDTPAHARPTIRANTRLLISNPDMLHIGILPHHTRWEQFFRGLSYVILDEVHTYRGVFGSHIANVMRRFKRIARFYGANPQFILASATIANAVDFSSQLIEAPVYLIDHDGSACGQRHFLIYNPPVVDRELGLRRSSYQESIKLVQDLLAHHLQTIIFARSRRSVELLLTYLRNQAQSNIHQSREAFFPPDGPFYEPPAQETSSVPDSASGDHPDEIIRGYRSGYLPQQRRAIERGLRQGEVRAVVATTALELGVDIGSMGAALLVGYPGTITATRQQAGRAGRGEDTSLAVLVATADPLDQFLASHPEYLHGHSPEHALINPNNLLILLDHLRCAAFELPFQPLDSYGTLSPDELAEFLEFLVEQGALHRSGERYFWISDQYPAQNISLRSASANPIILRVKNTSESETENSLIHTGVQIIGQVDRSSALWMVHPQAIYMHEGQTYLVEELDLEQHTAWLRVLDSDYYTAPQQNTTVELIQELVSEPACGALKAYGEIQVTSQVTGYRKVRWYTNETLGQGEVNLPPTDLLTTGYWLALDESTVDHLRQQGLWSNDPNDYGTDWRTQRDLARSRDGYRCQVCGMLEQDRSHDVHHIIPFRSFSSAKIANQLENLVTLCHSCHHIVETAVHVRSGLAGLAYVLNHLAPFFLMCDTGDLGVHYDPQSPITEGEPTVIIYDQIPAGIGLSQNLFELHDELMQRARELVAACACADGCPSCVGPASENGLGCKRETLAILQALVRD